MQIPFFLAACDYTIIGDEYYAASAYLSREPTLLGSLVGQDYGKILMIGLVQSRCIRIHLGYKLTCRGSKACANSSMTIT
jgi:hypothetical protein